LHELPCTYLVPSCYQSGHESALYMFLVGDDLKTLKANPNLAAKALAVIDLASNVALVIPFEGELGRAGMKAAVEVGEHGLSKAGESAVAHVLDGVLQLCTKCFPAGTTVTTPHGVRAIETLRRGDLVMAENPQTGKVEAEPVQAVVQEPASAVLSIQLSDGSAITATADHPFWVDGGQSRRAAGWVEAGDLQPQDLLRTVSGKDVRVIRIRFNVGRAVVYTLTVAHDHTFFVGSAQVLVHNRMCIELANIVNPDVAEKGIHIKVNGVELKVLPGYGGEVVLKPVFSKYSKREIDAAIKAAQQAFNDPAIVRKLYEAAERATAYLGKSGNPRWVAKSAETAFLMKALSKLLK